MPKEWILNSATNRFQLNFKRNVGAVSEAIRKCAPKNIEEWEQYYFKNIRSKGHIEELGRKLYVKITEVIVSEVDEVTEEDCIEYMLQLVIDRTYDGYMTEIRTVYGQLQNFLDVKIEAAPDEWDRLFNVDFFIKVRDRYIGLQIKPASGVSHIPEIFKERNQQLATHRKFAERYGGKVFYIVSVKEGKNKIIYNKEVIDEILAEIKRLGG
ncbi:MAG: MjaI family restriction endonuclease [Calditrichaceae bacterium]|nr:MjaI family restriction endonuclease [Calditrichia bacterium]NUQ41039.1 MjaI family restriction endonuclease [Calditrichaceae bacterium]